MATVKSHLRSSYGALAEHNRALAEGFEALASQHDEDSKLGKVYASLGHRFAAIAGHYSNMKEVVGNVAEMTPQGALVAPLVANQPFLDRPPGIGKASDADDLDKLRPDNVRGVLIPANHGAVSEQFEKVFGRLDESMPVSQSGIVAVPRSGQPPLNAKPNVDVQFEHLVKVEDDL
jgi:hypothetical protein